MAKVSTVSRLEYDVTIKAKNQIIKWLIAALILTQLMWASTWVAFWYAPAEEVTYTETVEDGSINFINNSGEMANG